MELTPEVAFAMFAASHIAAPLLNALLSRRHAKHEAAVEQVPVHEQRLKALEQERLDAGQVPILVQQMGAVAADVKDIKADLRRVGEHESALRLVDLRLKALETWQAEARPQLARAAHDSHTLMGERNALRVQHPANLVDPQKAARSTP